MKGICHIWSRGRHFSPSMPGDRYLKLSPQKRPPGRNLGEHRLVRRSGTTSRGTALLVFGLRMRSFLRTKARTICEGNTYPSKYTTLLIALLVLVSFTCKYYDLRASTRNFTILYSKSHYHLYLLCFWFSDVLWRDYTAISWILCDTRSFCLISTPHFHIALQVLSSRHLLYAQRITIIHCTVYVCVRH